MNTKRFPNSNKKHILSQKASDTILEFTMMYLLEQPEDLFEYASNYFWEQNVSRRTQIVYPEIEEEEVPEEEEVAEEEEEEERPQQMLRKRKPVFAESVNPETDMDEEIEVHPKTEKQRADLQRAVANVLLFRNLDPTQMKQVIDAMFYREVQPFEYIITQGDDGDYFYVIDSGFYEAYIDEGDGRGPQLVYTYVGQGSFGELALLYNQPRAATVRALSSGGLWVMDRKTFKIIVVRTAFLKRKKYEKFLNSVPILESLSTYEKSDLADALMPKEFKDGEAIITAGDEPDGMYIVESGRVSIKVKKSQGEETEVRTLGEGGFVGEIEMVKPQPRLFSVYAIGDCRMAFLNKDVFMRLLGDIIDMFEKHIAACPQYEQILRKHYGTSLTALKRSMSRVIM